MHSLVVGDDVEDGPLAEGGPLNVSVLITLVVLKVVCDALSARFSSIKEE